MRQLATGRWIAEHHHVLLTGATGVGKTYLACALGQQGCRQGYRVLYLRVPRLFDELALAHADGSNPHVLARFARIDVLVLDDWGLGEPTVADAILDRVVHRAVAITLTGPSRRKEAPRADDRDTWPRPWTVPYPWTPENGAHRSLENRTDRGFPQRSPPDAHSYGLKTRTARTC